VSSSGGTSPVLSGEPWRDQVQQGLVGLGWSAKDADRAVETVSDQAGDQPDVPALLRAALRSLSRA
jgi:holliday junction DNA helicase RuvA